MSKKKRPRTENDREYDRRRGTRQKRGYTNAWLKLSRERLRKHPWCLHCLNEGNVVPATVTDHIEPVRLRPLLVLDEANLQSLCHRHNIIKGKADRERIASLYKSTKRVSKSFAKVPTKGTEVNV